VGGTCFTAVVPVYLEHPEGEHADDLASAAGTAPTDRAGEDDDEDDEVGTGLPRLLVVEDNADLRSFMASDLEPEFEVLVAANGEQGLAVARAEIPDLVLSDVMMPGMDGFELCRLLKEDERTSHVPVILLTARSEAESRHAGLRLGADDYLAKPFDAEDLRLRIRNLIEQRRKLAATYERRLAVLSPEAMPVTSADERFILQLRQAIDANLDEPDFRINELCREVGMSRSQLHRKLTAVTGKTTSEFVRTHRLQRAAQLFDGGYGNVTEVAYAVGFRNLSYFARCFRDLYGQHPSEYLRVRDRG
jgi:DNA-binding response OmpR family regulator